MIERWMVVGVVMWPWVRTSNKEGDVANLEAKECKRGACKLIGAKVDMHFFSTEFCNALSRGWSFTSTVPGQMTHLGGSISLDSFLSSILLVVVIVVTVAIVVVILIFVVVAIVGVVIVVAIIRVVIVVTIIEPGVPIGIVSVCHGSSLCFKSCDNTISNQLPNGGLSYGGCCRFDLTGDEDHIDKDGDTGVGDSEILVSLGEISSGGRKS
nr:hypothetical protein [Tanacetum cinerariifolium]